MTRSWMLVGVMAGALLVAFSADARERQPHERGWYAGLGVSQNTNGLTEDYLNSRTWVVANPAETNADNQSLGFSVYAGWRFMRYLALDVAYVDFGETDYHLGNRLGFPPQAPGSCGTISCPVPPSYSPSDYSLRTTAFRVAVKGTLPIGERWALEGHLGLGTESWSAHDGAGDRVSSNELMGMIGLGGSYSITNQWRLHLDWDRYVPLDPPISAESTAPYSNGQRGAIYEALDVNAFSLNIEYRL